MAREIRLKKFQDDFIFTQARHPAMVSAWATGKSMSAIMKGMILSEESKDNLGLICRNEFTDLRDSTMKDFELYTGLSINKDRKEVRLSNGSVIMFRHAKELDTLKNINLGWFCIEQAEEMESDEQFEFLVGRNRRAGVKRRVGFLIANTNGHNWIWKKWKISPPSADYKLWEATTFENADNLPADYMADLEVLKRTSPHVYNRYVLNSWEEADTANVVIQREWVERAINRQLIPMDYEQNLLTCDPAAGRGGDESVIYALQNTGVVDVKVLNVEPMSLVGEMGIMREKHKSDLIAVESVGVGEGIVSRLRELYPDQPHIVLPVNPGMASNYPEQFKNLRAEMWWKAAELLRDGLVSIPNDPILVEQLSTPKYSIKSDRVVAIEDKEEIKKRLGRSPDRADALIQGLYALRFTPNALAHIRLEKVRARRWSGDEVYDEHVGDLI